jgi:ferric-dicitrate binding protein FerR (iron transport regulator)
MNEPESPDLLNALRVGPVGVSSPDDVERARADMVPWLEHQVALLPLKHAAHSAAERRKNLMLAGGALAAAAAVALVVFASGTESRAPWAGSGPQEQAMSSSTTEEHATLVSGKVMSGSVDLLAGSRLGLSSRVETGKEEGATLRASGGYELKLARETEMAFLPDASTKHGVLRLYRGVVSLSVSPLPQGSALVVLTDDAKVSVVGTQFSVEAHTGGVTCVRVTAGQVKVERTGEQRLLGAGESWGCEEDASSGEDTARATPGRKASAQRTGPTTLQQESALLSAGISQERRGQAGEAKRAYEELLRKYPRSSFAQDARAGLDRLKADAPGK